MSDDELSDYGKLNEHERLLDARMNASSDEGERKRLHILIENIRDLKKHTDDKAILQQFARNTMDLERYLASKRGQ